MYGNKKLAWEIARLQQLSLKTAEQLDQRGQEVQLWQDESIKVTNSLEQTQDQLEEALKREQDLQSRLTSLQSYVDRHAHRITVPCSP